MKKMLALLAVLCSATAAFAQTHEDDAVVRWKTIVGNITVSNNDAVGGINPGTTPWSTVGGRARVNLATGQNFQEARRQFLARRWPAARLHRRRQRRGAICRAQSAGRADAKSLAA